MGVCHHWLPHFYLWHVIVCFLLLLQVAAEASTNLQLIKENFALLCLCSGRFGNQMEILLGTISQFQQLNRTLVLPHFVHYSSAGNREFIAYSQVFDMPLLQQHNNGKQLIVMPNILR